MKMTFTENREEVLFVVFGAEKVKVGQEANSYIVKENESLTGLVTEIRDSPTYKKVYQFKLKDQTKPIVVTGKTALNDQMGYGEKVVPHVVKVGDTVRLTYLGMHKTGKGKDAYKFKVEIDL